MNKNLFYCKNWSLLTLKFSVCQHLFVVKSTLEFHLRQQREYNWGGEERSGEEDNGESSQEKMGVDRVMLVDRFLAANLEFLINRWFDVDRMVKLYAAYITQVMLCSHTFWPFIKVMVKKKIIYKSLEKNLLYRVLSI